MTSSRLKLAPLLVSLTCIAAAIVSAAEHKLPPDDVAVPIARDIQGDTGSNGKKLALCLLYTRSRNNDDGLDVAIQLVKIYLNASTPTTIYVFTHEGMVRQLKGKLGYLLSPDILVLPIAPSSFVIPSWIEPFEQWHRKEYNHEYRAMGIWRAHYMPAFVQAMGHKYVATIDDDSFILSPVNNGTNLLERMEREGLKLAFRDYSHDPVECIWGLPELASYFIVAQKITPTLLFSFCSPQNLSGLYTPYHGKDDVSDVGVDAVVTLHPPSVGGWNGTLPKGNFLVFNLDWFSESGPTRFRRLFLASGGGIQFRWSEQGLFAMLWQLFLQPQQYTVLDFDYTHKEMDKARGVLAKYLMSMLPKRRSLLRGGRTQ